MRAGDEKGPEVRRGREPRGPVRAGDGNRTRVTSLEDWGSTIELRPRAAGSPGCIGSVAVPARVVAHRPRVANGV